jgi:3'-5' exoribonuclease
MKKITVDKLQSGEIEDFFVVVQCDRRTTKANKPFLSLVFSDATGEVPGVAWDNPEKLEQVLIPGTIVCVKAIVGQYENRPQLKVTDARPVKDGDPVDPSDFKARTPYDVNHMYRLLLEFKNSVSDAHIRALLDSFFENDTFAEQFRIHPAAKRMHHAYTGGLLEHTLSVVRACDLLSRQYTYLNRDLLIAGALLHDIGKLVEMQSELSTEYTTCGLLVGHIPVGSEMVAKAADAIPDFPETLKWQLQHFVLSHHGKFEFGSPVLPSTLEALVLHSVDYLDAQLFQAVAAIEQTTDETAAFTQQVFGLDRRIFIRPVSHLASDVTPAPVISDEAKPEELDLKGASPAQETLL